MLAATQQRFDEARGAHVRETGRPSKLRSKARRRPRHQIVTSRGVAPRLGDFFGLGVAFGFVGVALRCDRGSASRSASDTSFLVLFFLLFFLEVERALSADEGIAVTGTSTAGGGSPPGPPPAHSAGLS